MEGSELPKSYDVVIVGGGIGGYVAAIRAKQLGLSVAVVEKDKLGGTCLHRGCIPTKSLLHSAELLQLANKIEEFGVLVDNVRFDFAKAQQRKEQVVKTLFHGIINLLKKHKIDLYPGFGRVMGSSVFSPQAGTVRVELADESQEMLIPNQAVIVATGSTPRSLTGIETDGQRILDTDQILDLETLPKHVLIVGGGVVGVEFASMLSDVGVDVTIVESEASILIHEDQDIQEEITQQLIARGVDIRTSTHVLAVKTLDSEVVADLKSSGTSQEQLRVTHVLVGIGRQANTDDMGFEATEVQLDGGFIQVDSNYRTQEPLIYAIGDVIGGSMLAHAASYQGMRVMEYIAHGTQQGTDTTSVIPHCIYARPEIASIGLTEQEAMAQGYSIRIGKFPLRVNGKAQVQGETHGFIKIIVDKVSDNLLGAHLIGAKATELISFFSLGSLLDVSGWELSQLIYPHPTIAEAIGEAVQNLDIGAIHS